MSQSLIEKLRKARESTVEIDGRRWTIRRPTDLDMARLAGKDNYELLKFVAGWDMTEIDLCIPGGTAELVPFDADLFAEWIKDQPKWWAPLIAAVRSAYNQHAETLEADTKN